MGKVIAVEGIDATGKTSLCKALCKRLGFRYEYSVPCQYMDLGGSILRKDYSPAAKFLFYLSGIIAKQTELDKILSLGSGVVIDRSIYSTIAYHRVMGVDIDLKGLERLGVRWPDRLILLEASQAVRIKRLSARGTLKDHEKDFSFQAKVESGFRSFKNRLRIDTTEMSKSEVLETALHYLI